MIQQASKQLSSINKSTFESFLPFPKTKQKPTMFQKVCLVLALAACVSAYGYGGYGGALYGGSLATHTRQSVNYYPVASTGFVAPVNVQLNSQAPGINLLLRTQSSPINIQHHHVPSPGSFRETSSVDPAHVRVHTVTRPIIQELREIIAPRRLIRQQVLPVQEQVQTVIARQAGQFVNSGFGGQLVGNQFF